MCVCERVLHNTMFCVRRSIAPIIGQEERRTGKWKKHVTTTESHGGQRQDQFDEQQQRRTAEMLVDTTAMAAAVG